MTITGYPFSNGSRLTHESMNQICEGMIYTGGDGIKVENNVISLSAGPSGESLLTEITYSQLKALSDNGTLIAGMSYRITDFVTTVNTNDLTVSSAGHPFDIIVTADDENTLNENVRFVQHEGDTYFSGCDLAAWEGKYSVDNNTTRFAWADVTNGKGVIYYLKDEFDNECPYDFKNVVHNKFMSFKNSEGHTYINAVGDTKVKEGVTYYKYVYTTPSFIREVYITDTKPKTSSTVYNYNGSSMVPSTMVIYSVDTKVLTGVYTFSITGDTYTDATLTAGGQVYGNVIKPYFNNNMVQVLNKNIFKGEYINRNTFGMNCHDNSFEKTCYGNTFSSDCAYNEFGEECANNMFGNSCGNNVFGTYVQGNRFLSECNSNTLGDECLDNTFGSHCSYNELGAECQDNSFGNASSNNVLGESSEENSFGNDCWGNKLEGSSSYNSFGNECHNNKFGRTTYSNSFGDECYDNTFGDGCYGNDFGNLFHDNTGVSGDNSVIFDYCTFGGNNHDLDFTTNYSNKTLTNLYVTNSYKYNQKTSVPLGIADNVTYQQNAGFNSQGQFTVKAALD